MADEFFDRFQLDHIKTSNGTLRLRRGGEGPALLLLHGNPQTHAMWHAVAAQLQDRFTLVCPDLRGYGASFKPPVSPDHAPYAKREMAKDMVELMASLGYERFSLAGHDRGGRVAHRLAIDHPRQVEALAVLDIVPTVEHFEQADMAFGLGYYHWFWFAQPHPFPENLISASPREWFTAHTTREPKPPDFFHPQALADYLEAVQNPEMIRAMCEDYRAAASIDLAHDRISRESGQRIQCPLLVLWGTRGKIESWYEPLNLWQRYCDAAVSGRGIDTGHYLAEEAPDVVADELAKFFQDG